MSAQKKLIEKYGYAARGVSSDERTARLLCSIAFERGWEDKDWGLPERVVAKVMPKFWSAMLSQDQVWGIGCSAYGIDPFSVEPKRVKQALTRLVRNGVLKSEIRRRNGCRTRVYGCRLSLD